jgi:hypothetical protein
MCRWPLGDPRQPEFRFCAGGLKVGIDVASKVATDALTAYFRGAEDPRPALLGTQDRQCLEQAAEEAPSDDGAKSR